MVALLDADLPLRISAVISNRPDAPGLELARSRGIAVEVVDHRLYAAREDFDGALQRCIDRFQPGMVVLAGFMRILTPGFVQHYEGRLLNIHPSLLPSFPGLDTHRRALAEGVRVHGCTVHFVTPELDHGPIVAQAVVPVFPEDTETLLAHRVLALEHVLYPQVLRWWAAGRLRLTPESRVEVAGQPAWGSSGCYPGPDR